MAFENADSSSQHTTDSTSRPDKLNREVNAVGNHLGSGQVDKTASLPTDFGNFQIVDNGCCDAGSRTKPVADDIAHMMFNPEWLPALDLIARKVEEYKPYLLNKAPSTARKDSSTAADRGVLIPTSPGHPGSDATAKSGSDKAQSAPKDGSPEFKGAPVYLGEGINKDVSAKHGFLVQDGDTAESVAKMQLGKDASKDDIARYVKEMAHMNDLGHPAKLTSGERLNLPGHTTDGGFITTDEDSTRTTIWPNGTQRQQYADGHWVTHKPGTGGGYQEEHGGNSRPENNFVLVKTQDGRYYTTDQMDQQPNQWDKNGVFGYTEIAQHKELDQLAEQNIKDPQQLAKFRADMARFEERMHNQDPDFTSLKCAGTYKQIERLLQAQGDQPPTQDQRLKLAEQVMSQAASPQSIDQGGHATCNVASLESRTYTRTPYEAAQMVADAALTSQYKAQDGTVVKLDGQSLQPDLEARVNPPQDGMRSYASQIFQVTAANIGIEQENQKTDPPRQWRYEQHQDGEHLMDYSKNPAQEVKNDAGPIQAPNLRDDQIVAINSAITGESKFDDVLIAHQSDNIGPGTGVTRIGSESELNDKIAQIAKDGKFPVIIQVDAKAEPFFSDNNNSKNANTSETHVVTITGYEAGPPAKVSIDGQWGSKSDHRGANALSVHDLYLAMRSPADSSEEMKQLQADVEANRGKPNADVKKEFELTRFTEDAKNSNSHYDDRLSQSMKDAQARWKQAHPDQSAIDRQAKRDHDRDIHAFMLMIKDLPPNRQKAIIDQVEAVAPEDQDLQIQIAKMQAMQRTTVGVVH